VNVCGRDGGSDGVNVYSTRAPAAAATTSHAHQPTCPAYLSTSLVAMRVANDASSVANVMPLDNVTSTYD